MGSVGDMNNNTATPTLPASPSTGAKPPPWRDIRVLRVVVQLLAVAGVGALLYWLFIVNLIPGLEETGIDVKDFGFLNQPTNFEIRDAGFDARQPVWKMVVVGIKNTLLSASVGIVMAVVLGILIGIARLSSNWVVSKLAAVYVEAFRNTPALIIIILFGDAIFTNGPFPIFNPNNPPWQYKLPGSDTNYLILSKDRWGIPSFIAESNAAVWWIIVGLGALVAVGVWIWRTQVNIRTGAPHRRVLFSFGALAAIAVISFVALGGPYSWSWPAVSESGRRIVGGFATNAGYISLTIALGLYTASHIAEIIRGSILAVHKGQSEASNALALSGFQRYRYVILPQAMRIAIPPTINQFLNLVKNTSLGIAVAFPEITSLTKSSIGNGRPAVQSLFVLMAVYLFFSIVISTVLNFVNKNFQLVGRT